MSIQIKVISSSPSDYKDFKKTFSKIQAQFLEYESVEHFANVMDAVNNKANDLVDCFFIFDHQKPVDRESIRTIRLHRDFLFAPVVILKSNYDETQEVEYVRCGAQDIIDINNFDAETLKSVLIGVSGKIQVWSRLKNREQSKQDQVAIVSHDLKSPLAIIKSYTDILIGEYENQLPPKAIEKLERIKYNAHSAFNLVVDILDEFRAKKNWRLSYVKLPLLEVVEECILNYKLKLEEKKISINIVSSPKSTHLLYADKRSIIQMLSNILENSIKFSPVNSVIDIEVDSYQQFEKKKIKKSYIRLVVTDDGPGIPNEKLVSIFDSYQQARMDDRKIGFGLGLNICKRICQLHMGKIWATNNPSRGASVHVLIPEFKGSREKKSSSANFKSISYPKVRGSRTVLVVDDLLDVRKVTSMNLGLMGIRTLTAANGMEALEILENEPVDLVLMDLNMPKMSGDKCIKIIRRERRLNVPIFLYSIMKSDFIFGENLRRVSGFLQKPIDLEEFETKTNLLLNWEFSSHRTTRKKLFSKHCIEEIPNQVSSVLLVDDCIDNHEIVNFYLTESKHSIDSAMSGKECIRKMTSKNYDLILLDMSMPDMNGLETLAAIKSIKSEVPIIAFTVEEVDMNGSVARSKGFDGFLAKPASKESVLSLINNFGTIEI